MKRFGPLLALWPLLFAFLLGCGADRLSEVETQDSPPDATPTTQPTATPDLSADFVAYLNPNLGFALQHPPSWVIAEGDPWQIATDPDLLENTDGATTGAILAITPIAVFFEDLAEGLEEFVGEREGMRVIEPAEAVTINGQEAAAMTLISIDSSGIEYTLLFRLIRHQGAIMLVSAVTPDHERYQPILEAVIDTVIISAPPPTSAPPTLTPVPIPTAPPADPASESGEDAANETAEINEDEVTRLEAAVPPDFVQLVDANGRYSVGYPPEWLLNAEEPEAVLLASSELLLNDNVFTDGGAAVWLFPAEIAVGSDPDPVLILEQFIANFPIYDSFDPLILPRPLLINGQAGAASRYDTTIQGAPVIADYYVAVNGSRFVVLVGLAAADSLAEMTPLIDGMAASLTVQ